MLLVIGPANIQYCVCFWYLGPKMTIPLVCLLANGLSVCPTGIFSREVALLLIPPLLLFYAWVWWIPTAWASEEDSFSLFMMPKQVSAQITCVIPHGLQTRWPAASIYKEDLYSAEVYMTLKCHFLQGKSKPSMHARRHLQTRPETCLAIAQTFPRKVYINYMMEIIGKIFTLSGLVSWCQCVISIKNYENNLNNQ